MNSHRREKEINFLSNVFESYFHDLYQYLCTVRRLFEFRYVDNNDVRFPTKLLSKISAKCYRYELTLHLYIPAFQVSQLHIRYMLILNSTARRASISKFVENYVLPQVQFNAIEILKIAAETPRTFRSQDRSLFLNTFYEFR